MDSVDPPILDEPLYAAQPSGNAQQSGEPEDAQLFNSVRFGMRSNVIRLLSNSRDLVKVMGK